jgi:zinc transporter 2
MNGLSIRYSFVSGDYGSIESPRIDGSSPQQQQQSKNLNIQAAYIHAVGDFLQSIGVIIAGGLIWAFPHTTHPMVQLSDPIATFLFSLLVLYSTMQVLKTSVNVLMEGVPAGLDPARIKRSIGRIPGVLESHDLHIWSLSLGNPFLSVHVVLKKEANSEVVLRRVHELLSSKFGISHSTVQVETDAHYTDARFKRNTECHAYAGDDV